MYVRMIALFLATLATAHAGDTVYQCKTAVGIVFSDHPCDTADQTQAVKQYSAPPISGEVNPFDQFVAAPRAVDNSVGRRALEMSVSPIEQQADPARGYQCSANGKTWIQSVPCPSSSTAFVPITGFSGFDQHGNYIASGTGAQRQTIPVEQEELSHSDVCDRLRAQMQTSEHDKGQSSVYDRNKMRQAEGC